MVFRKPCSWLLPRNLPPADTALCSSSPAPWWLYPRRLSPPRGVCGPSPPWRVDPGPWTGSSSWSRSTWGRGGGGGGVSFASASESDANGYSQRVGAVSRSPQSFPSLVELQELGGWDLCERSFTWTGEKTHRGGIFLTNWEVHVISWYQLLKKHSISATRCNDVSFLLMSAYLM